MAATPGQIRRMIAWEAAIVALAGSAAGIWPGIVLGRAIAHGLMSHGIVPPDFALRYDWLPGLAADPMHNRLATGAFDGRSVVSQRRR